MNTKDIKDVFKIRGDASLDEQYYLSKIKALSHSDTNEEILKKIGNIESILETITEAFETITDLANRITACLEYIQSDTECLRTAAGPGDNY